MFVLARPGAGGLTIRNRIAGGGRLAVGKCGAYGQAYDYPPNRSARRGPQAVQGRLHHADHEARRAPHWRRHANPCGAMVTRVTQEFRLR